MGRTCTVAHFLVRLSGHGWRGAWDTNIVTHSLNCGRFSNIAGTQPPVIKKKLNVALEVAKQLLLG